jgi:hypothetical protein
MFGLSRLLALAGEITWHLNDRTSRRHGRRRPVRRTRLELAELEDRVVPTLLGQQLFPTDYPWNQNISNAPVAANSGNIITHIGSSIHIHPDWGNDNAALYGNSPLYGIPFNVVHGNTTAKVNVTIDNYPGESDSVAVPIPANAVIEGDLQNGPNATGAGYNTGQRGDSHLIVWDEDNNIAYELFGVSRPNDPTLFPDRNGVEHPKTDTAWHAAQESVWNMSTDSFRSLGWTSADAAGLSILAGLVRPDEGLPISQGGQGAILHALRFTLPSGDVNPQYIYPASHVVNDSSGSTKLPFGARLRLQNTPAVNTLINAMGPEAQIIAHAMQQYGLVLADIGSSMYVTGSSASQDANNAIKLVWNMNDVLGLATLNAGDFDVVNLTPVVTGLSVNSGPAGTTVTITGQNFSGSAGHLSVFFGSNPATSVTYVDDAHITAVVPNGSGTVNVTVQSGVNATDPNNPTDNVNNPIFGYGTSAVTASAQFTYGGPSVSGTNSTASFAASTVVSGSGDTLTIVVKDTTGSAVTGLASGAFSFSFSGGTSAGTFGTVSETATHGTYTVTFAGTTAGTASALTVIVNGATLTTKPSVTVTVGPISGATSTVSFASSSVASGNTDTVTIVVKDAAGNAISGLTGAAFGLVLSGGVSAGSFGTVTETTTHGTYTATFTASTAGTASTLTATVSGVALSSKPTVQVTSGGISGTNSTVSFASASVVSGNTDTVTIVVKDGVGNAVSGLASSAFIFALSGGTSAGGFGAVTETATHGTYTATFTASTAGSASSLTVTVSGVAITTKPSVTVTPGTISTTNSTVSFASPSVNAGGTDSVTIVVRDGAGNAITGLAGGSFSLGLSGASAGSFGAVTETATHGTYTATFSATTAGTASMLTVSVSGVTLSNKPAVTVTAGTVSGTNSTASFASSTVALGSVDTLTVVVKDAFGNAVSGLAGSAFTLSFSGGASAGAFGTATETATKGTYTDTFTGTTAGTAATLTVTVSGVTLTGKPTVTVTSAPTVVVAQLGSRGVWQYNQTANTWVQLTPSNASLLVADLRGDVVAEFPGYGVWEFQSTGGWKQLNGVDASQLAVGSAGNVVAEFPGYGVGLYQPATGWRSLTAANATLLATDAAGDVAGEFPGYGVWLYQSATGWKLINGTDVTLLAMNAPGNIVVDFPGYGVAEYTLGSGWRTLNGMQAQALAVNDQGDVTAQFQGFGVGLYVPASGWQSLTSANASVLALGVGLQGFGDFAGYGVWEYDPVRGWVQLNGSDASLLAVA